MPRLLSSLLSIIWLSVLPVSGQMSGIPVKGKVLDPEQHPLEMVNVSIKGTTLGVVTNSLGEFSLPPVSGKSIVLVFSFVGYETSEQEVSLSVNPSVSQILKPVLQRIHEIVVEGRVADNNLVTIPQKLTERLPAMAGSVETLIKTLPGVSNNNELSSQYSVRGGNYDENLVYVNGIEIIRPFLVKSGEQEGLSFINNDMVSSIGFSSGGFDASYGDKMSSVLDITYRKPDRNGASAEIGALGASAHFEGSAAKGKFSHLTGIRYKNTAYLLGTLDKKGEYNPSFTDIQTYLNYKFNPHFSLGFLGNYASNIFQFIPETRLTKFGTLTNPYEFLVYFEGKERDKFENYLGALAIDYSPNSKLSLKFQASSIHSSEKESFDILGEYYLSDINQMPESQEYPDSSMLIGTGSYLDHARNSLIARVSGLEHRGTLSVGHHKFQWGLKYQHERISDRVNEWEMRDSTGYSLPYGSDNLALYRYVSGSNDVASNRFSGFIQDSWTTGTGNGELAFTGGIRMQYWDYNQQTIVSPRISGSWKIGSARNRIIRAAWGVYNQMPFFKELKNREAQIVKGIKAQKAVHYLLGYDQIFTAFNRPFRFTTEVWYKALSHLVPYQIDNLNIRYIPDQQAIGYATGIDFKINGEFVPGAQSWASLSLMKTEEDIIGDFYLKENTAGTGTEKIHPGYIPRPTDQRFNFSLFFQDYFPGYPSVKMSMTLFYGSRLPFGPPQGERYLDTFRMPPYRRVDVGFSKALINNEKMVIQQDKKYGIKEAWIGLELFNLFDINNTISYFWISDIKNQMHAVPNYLTGRRINLKLGIRF
ncbi:MAG: carboxypeptidase-like regulatory domain-containing protein [Bacteroidia bacterium]|nr:carboxypeptidase-like regulatory domain-containing protein [Bacteroidia bacterium]